MGSLFQNLKKRKVFTIAAVYAVVAWLTIQIVDVISAPLNLPDWFQAVTIVLFAIGFPIALILAWAYEITPEGIKPDSGTQAKAQVPAQQNQLLIYATFALVLLVAGFQIVALFDMNADSSPVIEADSNNSTANISERVRRVTVNIGPMLPALRFYSNISLSADGSRLAFTSFADGKIQLHIRELDQLQSRTLGAPIESNGRVPLAFSPDSEWLAYSTDSGLNKISIADESTQQLFTGEVVSSLSWTEDNAILFSSDNGSRLRSVPDSGGTSSLLVTADSSGVLTQPKPLPGGKGFLLTRIPIVGGVARGTVDLFNVESGDTQLLITNATAATYSPTGHIVFMRSGDLWAVPFKLDAMQISGAAVRVIEAVDGTDVGGGATYTLSSSGDLIYLPEVGGSNQNVQPNSTLSWVDRTGAETPLEVKTQGYAMPSLSPDGSQVAVVVNDQAGVEIWVYDLVRSTLSRVTYEGFAISPLWSPTGNELIFGGRRGIRSASVNGIGESEVLLSVPAGIDGNIPTTLSPDGMQVVYSFMPTIPPNSSIRLRFSDILSLSMAPEHTSRSVIATDFIEKGAAISPNGLWLAYTSNETGRDEVFVRPYPDTDNDKHLVSTSGGNHPQWAADTGELFYQNDTDDGIETYAVNIAPGNDFIASIPELLFTSDHVYNPFYRSYSVAADGQRFMVLKVVGEAEPIAIDTNLVLINNFAAELIRRVPADAE